MNKIQKRGLQKAIEECLKSKQIQSVGKNAFKGIYKNAKIKIPKKKMKLYKSIFNRKGQKKISKVSKIMGNVNY